MVDTGPESREPGWRRKNADPSAQNPEPAAEPAPSPKSEFPAEPTPFIEPELDDEGLDGDFEEDLDDDFDDGDGDEPRRRGSFVKALVSIVLLGAIAYGGWLGVQKLDSFFNGPADYDGRGTTDVVVTIEPGSDGAAISRTLHEAGVTKSAEVFYQLLLNDSRAASIQAGSYQLRKEMKASLALEALLDPASKVEDRFTIPEGTRASKIVEIIAASTDIPAKDLEKALDDTDAIGLPAEAEGNPEGWLFPATYVVEPNDTAVDVIKKMVDQSKKVALDVNLAERAGALGLSEHEALTIASIIEREGRRDEDFGKISRVIHNRLDDGMPLQMDSTVHYVADRDGDVWTTEEERKNPSAYNTYEHAGLPPGPIASPGKKAIEAALNPTEGKWMYFITIDTDTGETVFTNTYAEHVKVCRDAYGAGAGC